MKKSSLKVTGWLMLLFLYVQGAIALSDTAVVRVISTIEPSCGVHFSGGRSLRQLSLRAQSNNVSVEEVAYLCNVEASNAFMSYRWMDIDTGAYLSGAQVQRYPFGNHFFMAPGSSQAINLGPKLNPLANPGSTLVVTVINN